MFAADAELDLGPGRPAALRAQRDKLPDALDVEADERIARENALLHVNAQETARIVARQTQRRLGEIVGAKAEEHRFFRDVASHQRGARQFDHGADEIVERIALLGKDLIGNLVHQLAQDRQFAPRRDQRDHDLGHDRLTVQGGDIAGRLEGKSSLGRLGLLTHSTAGFIDPGFSGHITLELSNVANLPVKLFPGMKIGQLCLIKLSSPAENPYGSALYGSRYQGQRGPTASKSWLNFHQSQIK